MAGFSCFPNSKATCASQNSLVPPLLLLVSGLEHCGHSGTGLVTVCFLLRERMAPAYLKYRLAGSILPLKSPLSSSSATPVLGANGWRKMRGGTGLGDARSKLDYWHIRSDARWARLLRCPVSTWLGISGA